MKSKILILAAAFCCTIFFSCDTTEPEKLHSWVIQKEKSDDARYYGISFGDEENGWICGENGIVRKTSDGGNSWKLQETGTSVTFWDILFLDKNTGWVCGFENTILKTKDGGETWIDVSPSAENASQIITEIEFFDETTGWASSNYGRIYKTTDGGDNWEIKKSGLIGGSRLSAVNSETLFALAGRFFKTLDGGETWSEKTITTTTNERFYLVDHFFIDENYGWIATTNVYASSIPFDFPVLFTRDGGETWTASEYIEGSGSDCIYFVSRNVGWLGSYGKIYKTLDGGETWMPEYENELFLPADIDFVNPNSGWILDIEGRVYRYNK